VPLIISTTDNLSRFQGFHVGGQVLWKGLAAPSAMAGDWDALECAELPAGGVAGLHAHSHTEEIWYYASGQGVATLGDQELPAGPGTLILSSYDCRHGNRQVGDELLLIIALVVNVPVPRTRVLAEDAGKGHYLVRQFNPRTDVSHELSPAEIETVLVAPWRGLGVVHLPAGESYGPRKLTDSETFLFVTAGRGVVRTREGPDVDLSVGMSLTCLLGTELQIQATGEALSFFLAELAVPSVRLCQPIN
jgi:mannose-6-phosphate isomerase-like protein (cupin superfamily)